MQEVHLLYLLGVVCALWTCVKGHGRLVDPPARSTMWRLGFNTPVHYNDHQLFCGGYARQWMKNHGRCGECGDPWDLPRPRPNEAGGTWGTGVISKVYRQGEIITATVHLTANHMGWFEFRLCPNDNPKQYVKQSCLNKHVLQLVDYPGTRYHLKHSHTGLFRIRLQLPEDIICSQCVVQWHYTTGNNWGFCKDGSNQPGCGPQEVFRGCSDVAIFTPDDPTYFQFLNLTTTADLSQFLHLKETPELETEVQENPTITETPQTNDVNVAEILDVDFEKVKDVKPDDRFRTAFITEPNRSTSRRPSITFIDDRHPANQQNEDNLFSLSQVLGNDRQQQNTFSGTPPKKYVSSDAFRKNHHLDKSSRISAPTPFLPLREEEPKPIVINPYSIGVTPSPLGPPLVFPPPSVDPSPIPPGGLHSIHSSQPPEEYEPILGEILGKSALPSPRKSTLLVPAQDSSLGSQDISLSTLKLLQNFPSLLNSGLTSKLSEDSLQRLMILQQALGLVSPSSSSPDNDSPVVLILV